MLTLSPTVFISNMFIAISRSKRLTPNFFVILYCDAIVCVRLLSPRNNPNEYIYMPFSDDAIYISLSFTTDVYINIYILDNL